MMPNAKMLARVKAPPVKIERISTIPPPPVDAVAIFRESTPGSTM
jgi:hypothetical protein